MTKYKILALIANHTCNKVKYNISLNNISLIKEYVTDIIIIDTKDQYYAEQLKNDIIYDKKILNYLFVENDNYYDFGKWTYALNLKKKFEKNEIRLTSPESNKVTYNSNLPDLVEIEFNKYDYVLFLNDSIILMDEIKNYFSYIDNVMLENTNLYAYNDSTQIKYHYQSYLFLLKSKIINKFLHFFESKKKLINNLESLINNVELNMCNIDDNHECFLKIGSEYNMSKNLYWENEVLYQYLLSKNIFALIKLKKIYDIQKEYKITIYGYSISDFDYKFYREYYEFKNKTDKELLDNFIEIGQYEGRKHNKIFNVMLPSYYREKLNKLGILYFFDIPDDFDVYYYKKNNNDVSKFSIIDTVFHYINYGIYEGRIYNKKNDNDIYLNKYYLNLLKKQTELPNDFNIYSYILLNNKLDKNGYIGIIKDYLKLSENKLLVDSKNQETILYTKNDLIKILSNIDITIYKKKHPELNNYDTIHIISHYINNRLLDSTLYKVPKDFNLNNYKKIYKDLHNFNDVQLKEHYLLHGISEGRIYKIPDDFDYVTYKNIYNDVSNLNNAQIKDHYLFQGISENRIYKLPSDFNCNIYKKIYRDLVNLNDIQLKENYMIHGIKNNRIYKIPDDFDYKSYKIIYRDLYELSDEELKKHYLFDGIHEKRIYKLPTDFDCNIYKKIYKDLSELTDEQLKNHYLYQGIFEKRIYKLPDDFNCDIYRLILKNRIKIDLKLINDEEVKNHYLFSGIAENIIYKIPNDFDTNFYKNIYDDLAKLTNEKLKEHYLIDGFNEGRYYKMIAKFNPSNYRRIYKDLEKMDDFQLMKHYILWGMKEKRIFELPQDFDCIIYKKIYKDLAELTDEQLKNHYLFYGINEKRFYKIPDDFDCNIYKNLYKDLSELTDEQIKNHFLFYGIPEKRIYKIIEK